MRLLIIVGILLAAIDLRIFGEGSSGVTEKCWKLFGSCLRGASGSLPPAINRDSNSIQPILTNLQPTFNQPSPAVNRLSTNRKPPITHQPTINQPSLCLTAFYRISTSPRSELNQYSTGSQVSTTLPTACNMVH